MGLPVQPSRAGKKPEVFLPRALPLKWRLAHIDQVPHAQVGDR